MGVITIGVPPDVPGVIAVTDATPAPDAGCQVQPPDPLAVNISPAAPVDPEEYSCSDEKIPL